MLRLSLFLISMLLMASIAGAQSVPLPQAKESVVEKPTAEELDIRRQALELRSEMNLEMKAAIEQQRIAVEALVAELESAADAESELAIQRRIHETKEQGRRDLLVIQLEYARRGGFDTQVQELETRIARMDEATEKAAPLPTSRRSAQGGDAR
jgi:hypothetical protein